MNLQCSIGFASSYRSASQITRVLTEEWCTRELYCPACDSDRLTASKANTPAVDFECPKCGQPFQFRADRTPNLLVLQYSADWIVHNLLLIPRVFFTESIVEKRSPLNPTARRAGWVGCNILLSQIPDDGRINVVSAGLPIPEQQVRAEFLRIRRLAELSPSLRGWTLDVLKIIRKLGKSQFSLQELYHFEAELKASHPQNENIRAKIRQQLQVLRDLRLIDFTSTGNYSLRN
jgi:type II restriction enzyme